MPIPETTSAEAFERYVGGKCLVACRGEAWRDIKAWIIAPQRNVEMVQLPSVSEPFLSWSISGEVDFQEREGKRPWITHRIRKGSFFLTSGGAPYDCRWKAVTPEPFEVMAVFIGAAAPATRAGGSFWRRRVPRPAARYFRVHRRGAQFIDGTRARRIAAPARQPAFPARHRAGHRHPSRAQLCRNRRRIAQRQSFAARLQAPANHRLDGGKPRRRIQPRTTGGAVPA